MSEPDLRRVEQIFTAAVEFDGAEREKFVESAAAGDASLADYVRRLLAAHDAAGEFLREPTLAGEPSASAGATDEDPSHAPSEVPGSRIGPYKLLQKIGEGGFGTVFMAEQQTPVVRRVALKVIKLGMDTRQVIARFEAERQALALMDHPNIARVFDAGATRTGRPYFVMELVRGDPITKYCDDERLTTRDRLALFQQVCRAVQHAHQKGIIHRDIKPSNVLVTVADGRPIAKMIDFGIAKATLSRLTERTLFTEHRQLIGTPQYMSPEQANPSGLDIDTRTDIYSLGVLLYELLTGTAPFDPERLRSAAFGEIQRIIREVEPPKPSSRLLALGPTLASIAERRHVEASGFGKLLRGDLDWIVMKAMEKDRARRYETAHGLSTDIDRHLGSEPVSAAPPSLAYTLRRFARRHRVGVLAGGAIAATLTLGVIGTTTGLLRAIRAQHEQERLRVQAEENQRDAEREAFTGNLAAASAAILSHDSAGAMRRLDRIPEALREWEWRCLHSQSDVSIATWRGHSGRVQCLALAPDGASVASGSEDRTIRVWDAATGSVIRTLAGVESPVTSVAWNPAGTRIASGTEGGTVSVWNPATGELLHSIRGHKNRVGSVAFDQEGTRIVSGSWDKTIKAWNAAGGDEPLLDLDARSPVRCLRFSPDGAILVSALFDGRILLWNSNALADPPRVLVQGSSELGILAFSPDGALLASSGIGGSIRISDVASGRTEALLPGGAIIVLGLSFSPDGRRLASAGTDGILRLWDARTSDPLATWIGHAGVIPSIQFDRDGARVYSCATDSTLKAWAVTSDPGLRTEGAAHRLATVVFSPDGTRIGGVCLDGALRIWDSLTGGVGSEEALAGEPADFGTRGDNARGSPLAFGPAGRLMASSAVDCGIAITDADTGETLRTLHGHTDVVRSLAFDSRDLRLASIGFDRALRVWDVGTGVEVASLPLRSEPSDIVYNADGSLLASGEEKELVVRDASTFAELWSVELEDAKFWSAAFSTDGSQIACCADTGTIVLCRPRTGERLGTLTGLGGFGTRAVFTADGTRLISATAPDNSIRVWDTTTRTELVALQEPIGGTHRIAISPDGSRVAQAFWGGQGGVRLLDTIPGRVRYEERQALRAAEPEARRVLDAAFAGEDDIALVARRLRENTSMSGAARRVALHLLLARGLAEEREIRALLAPLRKANPLPEELAAAVREDATFPNKLRARALRLAGQGSWPSRDLNLSAWAKVKAPGASMDSYRRGLREALEAARLAPHGGIVTNTLGVAQYRVGDYEAALATLTSADRIRSEKRSPVDPDRSAQALSAIGNPEDVAFLAMALHRLERADEAASTMVRLEALMNLDRWKGDAGARACQLEAEALIQRR